MKIPSLSGALELLEAGHHSSLAPANRSAWHWLDAPDGDADPRIHLNPGTPDRSRHRAVLELLVDPQTCGPLLIGVRNAGTRLESLHPWHRIGSCAVTQVYLAEQRRTLALASSADLSSQR